MHIKNIFRPSLAAFAFLVIPNVQSMDNPTKFSSAENEVQLGGIRIRCANPTSRAWFERISGSMQRIVVEPKEPPPATPTPGNTQRKRCRTVKPSQPAEKSKRTPKRRREPSESSNLSVAQSPEEHAQQKAIAGLRASKEIIRSMLKDDPQLSVDHPEAYVALRAAMGLKSVRYPSKKNCEDACKVLECVLRDFMHKLDKSPCASVGTSEQAPEPIAQAFFAPPPAWSPFEEEQDPDARWMHPRLALITPPARDFEIDFDQCALPVEAPTPGSSLPPFQQAPLFGEMDDDWLPVIFEHSI